MIQSPNMFLSIPTVGSDIGPTWALEINSSLTLIDQHDHSPSRGVQITPAGININASLSFNNNSALALSYIAFTTGAISTTIQSVSVAPASSINELFYTDSNGTQTQITKNGQVNVIASSIPGESYDAGTFVWTQTQSSSPTTPANFDIGSVTLRPNLALTTNGVQLIAQNTTEYSITLPGALPASNSFVLLDNAGNMSTTIPVSQGITATNIAPNTITEAQIAPGTITNAQISSSVVFNGNNLANIANTSTISSSGTFIVPSGVTKMDILACGGGGGGGAGAISGGGGGGGGASSVPVLTTATVVPGETLTITIGAAGTGAASTSAAGGQGGTTTVVNGSSILLIQVAGGLGGGGGSGVAGSGVGGTGNTSQFLGNVFQAAGGKGGTTGSGSNTPGASGTSSLYGTGGAGGAAGPNPGSFVSAGGGGGGAGYTGVAGAGGAGGQTIGAAGLNGTASTGIFGAGGGGGGGEAGGGTNTGGLGAAGGSGVVILSWYGHS
jgi:hypothetical protein